MFNLIQTTSGIGHIISLSNSDNRFSECDSNGMADWLPYDEMFFAFADNETANKFKGKIVEQDNQILAIVKRRL